MIEIISKSYVLEKLKEIMEDPEITTKDRLAALKLAGDYLKMSTTKLWIIIFGVCLPN